MLLGLKDKGWDWKALMVLNAFSLTIFEDFGSNSFCRWCAVTFKFVQKAWTYNPCPPATASPEHRSLLALLMNWLQQNLQSCDPLGLAAMESHTAYEGRVYIANSVRHFFSGEIFNPLKEETASKCSDAIYIPTGNMLFICEAHLFFKVDLPTPLLGKILLAAILIYAMGWRIIKLFRWGCLMPEVP